MPTNLKESGFEEFIQQFLEKTHGYRIRDAEQYEKELCLDPELVLEFIKTTQPDKWRKHEEVRGAEAGEGLLSRLATELKARGTLEIFRDGFSDYGTKFEMAYFRPETSLNDETRRLYDSNILSVTRQVKYSFKNENSIDTVLFLNGLPIFTVELKNPLTNQTVREAIKQYRSDRDPLEALLAFKRCLAHFAVDTEQAYLSTQLTGLKSRFLPFNKGFENGAGNPPNPEGYRTSYLWEDVWSRESVLELVGRFIHVQKEEIEDHQGKKTRVENLIFPRYHQRDTVRRLVEDARSKGTGQNYLIQHSAGSGKSNTIAWTAHRLSELHDAEDRKVFDSVLVVTDRRILDRQLRETVTQFEQAAGTVKPILEGSAELRVALESGEKIIITTLQKFPYIIETIGDLPGKKFAVILDEAHSSQSGEAAANLREALGVSDLDEAEKIDSAVEEDVEDMVLKKIKSRKVKTEAISYFAFTATPKQKTLELFGMKSPLDSKYYPFSLYSMKQAIEEGFILDVLKNYTTYRTYFELLKTAEEDPKYDKSKAERLLLSYVDQHEHAINKKTEIIIEHFINRIAGRIDGKAKVMVVTRSRLHAVRFKMAFDEYLRLRKSPYKALVAFSGKVKDGAFEYSESEMNGVPEAATAGTFKGDEYRFLIVAEKFQTGFDQPLLSAMYVDKKLAGVNAVQTLSRLNRMRADKDEVFVLDFVNDTDDILESFKPYYVATVLSKGTDPNVLHDLERDVRAFKLFSAEEVTDFSDKLMIGSKPDILNAILDVVVRRWVDLRDDKVQEEFRTKCRDYARKYAFISQIVPFENTDLERLFIFTRNLARKLPTKYEPLPYEVLESINMESFKIDKTGETRIDLSGRGSELQPMGSGVRVQKPDDRDILSRIVDDINERFGTDFTMEDQVIIKGLAESLASNKSLEGSIRSNPRDAAKIKFEKVYDDERIKLVSKHVDFYKKLDQNDALKKHLGEKLFDYIVRNLPK
ncbi:MAG: type I restriction endonuclease [Patescibacteria group bacterium]|jgi:type I restriction enzyme R subunit